MVEKGQPMRRSRRAASLTAQVLWNIQNEDDSKVSNYKPARKPSVSGDAGRSDETLVGKKGRKRSGGETTVGRKSPNQSFVSELPSKKQKLAGGCSGHIFPVGKPLQVGRGSKTHGKLTASVAPLIKAQPILPKSIRTTVTNTATSVSHVNPIFLLPVSLQTNQGPGHVNNGEVGNLPVLTVQASPDLFSCLGLNNKSITESNISRNQWNSNGLASANPHSMSLGLNTNNTGTVLANLARQQVQAYSNFSKSQNVTAGFAAQVEPLNLKMGETTVPSYAKSADGDSTGTHFQPVQACSLALPRFSPNDNLKLPVSGNLKKTHSEKSKITIAVKPNNARSKPHRKNSRSSPVSVLSSKQSANTRKTNAKCPSPEYVCSSPDVDDVHRDVRHSCKRQQINLRNKAAPPPGTREYERFVEEQRRLLADAKRRAERAKLKAKRAKLARKDSDEDRPLSVPEPAFKPQPPQVAPSNNGWKWSGNPYTALAFSVESGKHVKRCCYPGMTRYDKDGITRVLVRDCVFLLAGEEDELPYVAKVTALWEKPKTKEMMMSLVWYYRPEHTEDSRQHDGRVSEDELFASRHQDEISVACVEERCNVLTYSQYCRVQARLRRDGAWKENDPRRIVPRLSHSAKRSRIRRRHPGEVSMDPSDMFFCRKMYDVKGRRVLKYLPPPSSLSNENKRAAVTSI